jgi:hypothetical protein
MTELKKYNKMSLLLDTVVIFLGCVTVAFNERYTALITACCIYKKQHFFHLACNVTLNLLLDKCSRSARNAVLSFRLVCNGSTYTLIGLSQGQ